jgi:PAS domain S-box-containing protein
MTRNRLPIINLGLLALLVFLPFFLAAEVEEARSNTLLSGCEIDYPPFCFVHSDGRADGFSVELLQQSLSKMGREVNFSTGTWHEVRSMLASGEIEVLPLVGRTPEREEIFDFSVPYLTMYGAIIVREDNAEISEINDLRGKTVAVMKDDNAEEFLRRSDRGLKIITTPTFLDALQMLSKVECDAVVIQKLVGLRLLEESGLKNLKVVNRPIIEFRQDFCFAVKKGDSRTLALVNEGLALAIADGTYRHLHAKWFASLEMPSNRRIIIGGDHYYPPFEYLDEKGRPAGYSVDITRAVAKAAGFDVDIRLGYWPDVIRDLELGKIDVIQGMLYSTERDLKFDFSQPHTVSEHIIAYRKGTPNPPQNLAELAGKSFVVQDGDIMHDILSKKQLNGNMIIAETMEEALLAVSKGQYDCAVTPRLTALFVTQKHAIDNIEFSSQSVHTTEYCFAVANGNKALLAKFAEGLKTIEASGEYRQIQAKWLSIHEDQSGRQAILRHIVTLTIPLLIILLAVFGWSWTLRRQVSIKTRELQQSEAQFRSLVEGAPAGIFVQTDDRFAYLNTEACRLFGATNPLKLVGLPVLDLIHQSSHDSFKRYTATLLNEQKLLPTVEMYFLRIDGSEVPVDVTAVPINYHEKNSVLVFAHNITGRKASESELERLTAAIEQVGETILITDTTGVIQYVSPAVEGITGYSRAELLGKSTSIFKSGQHDDQFYKGLWRTISSGSTWSGRMVNKCKDGSFITEDATISPVFASNKIINYVAVKHDVTEHLRLSEQLQQAQKMEAIGQLAGGIAHDYNNMLGVILGYTEIALDTIDSDDSNLREYLSEIHKATLRSASITSQLLAFARKQTIAPKLLEINDTIVSMLKMLRRLIGENVELVWMPAPDELTVKMDPVQINQILANLCVNSRDAISGAGKIVIETDQFVFDEEYCSEHPGSKIGEYVLLSVSDNGRGMDKATCEKIFEPFFTTKEVGQGTGLGLATVFGIVKQNDGFINVYSEPGSGSIFKIYLPLYEGNAVARPAKNAPEQSSRSKGETILVVEDDQAILRLASKMLTRFGYKVICTSSTSEAISLVESGQKIDLLLTDVVMPQMNGRELQERLQKTCPKLRSLFMSGYTANVIAQHGILKDGINFIAKPFSNADLVQTVRQVLDQDNSNISTT